MKIAVLGCGLIGGSIGLAARAKASDVWVSAYDRIPEVAMTAVRRGAADEAADSPTQAVEDADIVFIATPVGAIADVARAVAPTLRAGCVITDVGSTKSRVVLEIEEILTQGVVFIGGHPMAGTEDEGIDAADPNLFERAWWILTPTERSEPGAYRRLHALLTTLGAQVMALRPDEHDELMSIISHLPQLIATTLMNLAAERGREHAGLLALAAGGFRDVTRVAASNPEIWLDICRENASAISATIDRFSRELADLADRIRGDDREALRAILTRARSARRSLGVKEIKGVPYAVRMPVPDRPGVLAEVTTSIGNLGINIEDLEISHATEGGRGTLHLTVAGETQAGRVSEALKALGFETKVTQI